MNTRASHLPRFWAQSASAAALILVSTVLSQPTSGATQENRGAPQPIKIKGPMCNIDDTVFFWGATLPKGKTGEAIDRYVDVMAEAGAGVLLCCVNARRTNYRTRVWDAYWDGYDPAGPDHQPFLAPIPAQDVRAYRQLIDNMLAVYQEGVDYPARMLARCRHHGISPWITLRMNDCHFNDISNHPFHGSFWKKNPPYARKNCPGYFATCLDYAHPEVRNFYRSLVAEVLDRYDMDGLELDFMREGYLFSAGKEGEGAPILTVWLGEMRKLVDAAAAKRGHLIRLGVRVPSRPETALGLGMEVAKWVQDGLVDVLVPTPRWATLEFDMPIEQWRQMCGTSKVALAGGLEIRYQPFPGGPAATVSPPLARGAAVNVLSRGADAVYLFNYFQDSDPSWPMPVYKSTLNAMSSLESLLKLPRSVGMTYRDITAPGEVYRPPLPATGRELRFAMRIGPLPGRGRRCRLVSDFAPVANQAFAVPGALVNGKPCAVLHRETTREGHHVVSFTVPLAALSATKAQEIRVLGGDPNTQTMYRVERVEMAIEEDREGK